MNVRAVAGRAGWIEGPAALTQTSRPATWLHVRTLTVVALVVILASATALRTYRINAVGFNSDEAVYAGQAAALANDAQLKPFFPIFRAHPLLFQSLLSVGYRLGGEDAAARLLSAAFGIATVYLVFETGKMLYGRRVGLCAALFMACMPYHVIVTRQVLLDGPMVCFATLSLYCMARFSSTQRAYWLYASGAAVGLTVITKETGILIVAAMYVFLAASRSITVRLRDVIIALGIMAVVMVPYPLAVMLSGKSSTGHNYLTWQLFRRPNHGLLFYPTTVPGEIGYLLIAAAVLGLWLHRRENSWRESWLLSFIGVHVVFFELWPVKGFQYLLPVAPAVAILAARAVATWQPGSVIRAFGISMRVAVCGGLAIAVIVATLIVPAWHDVHPAESGEFLAGTGGVPRGREAGHWMQDNVPVGAKVLTLGPSMANIVQFYAHRKSYGLSVSPNPLHRNPSYEALVNPDRALRDNEIQYVVWDAFSAARSPFFSNALMRYVARYHGREVHRETVPKSGGDSGQTPVILVYEVRP